jgi:hypothetical protein
LQKAIKIICPLPLKDKKKTKKTRQRDYSTQTVEPEKKVSIFDAIEERSSMLEAT